jgi:hypothetical protein
MRGRVLTSVEPLRLLQRQGLHDGREVAGRRVRVAQCVHHHRQLVGRRGAALALVGHCDYRLGAGHRQHTLSQRLRSLLYNIQSVKIRVSIVLDKIIASLLEKVKPDLHTASWGVWKKTGKHTLTFTY